MMRAPSPRSTACKALFALMVAPTGRPSIEIIGFHLVEAQEQRRSLEIEAQKARVYRTENITALDAVKTWVWGKDTKPFEVQGDFALVDSETQNLEIPTKAQVTSPDGFLFDTTELVYQASKRWITSDNPVEGHRGREGGKKGKSEIRLSGKGLTINLPDNTYEIRSGVKTEQRTAPGKTLAINSGNLIIFPDGQTARFSRAVSVKSSEFNIKGDRLVVQFESSEPGGSMNAKKMVLDSTQSGQRIVADLKSLKLSSMGLNLEMDPAEGGVKRTEAIGQAEATTKDGISMKADKLVSDTENGAARIALQGQVTILTQAPNARKGTCQEAVIYPESGEIILEKGASVTHEDQVIQGEKIRFSTKRSDIVVEKVRGSMDRKKLGN